jgi:hypothetical protein
MVTERFKAGQRPRIRVTRRDGTEVPIPGMVLTMLNSKTAYYRSPHVVGEMAVDADQIEIILHADGSPFLDSEHWPPLTPYDTGERLQPGAWVTPDPRRPEEYDRDRYGKVDFDDDESATLATIHVERVETCHIAVVYSAKTNTELRVNLDADLDLFQHRIECKGALTKDRLIELLREHGEGGDWIDVGPDDTVIDGRFDLDAIVTAINASQAGTEEEA